MLFLAPTVLGYAVLAEVGGENFDGKILFDVQIKTEKIIHWLLFDFPFCELSFDLTCLQKQHQFLLRFMFS